MSEELMELVLAAYKRSFQRAFEDAVRHGTALIYTKNGKIVEEKPPYRFELVPINEKSKKKKEQTSVKAKKQTKK